MRLGFFQQATAPDVRFNKARPYLEKEVAIGLDALPDLLDIRGATRVYVN